MKGAKKPWLKWFPTNWRADAGLRLCGLAARGLWVEMIGYMHEADPPGYLLVNGVAPTPQELAGLVGAPCATVVACLAELERKGVYSIDTDGRIYSRKMVRDIEKARKFSEFGKQGGNPLLNPTHDERVNPSLFPRGQKLDARGKSKGKNKELGAEGSAPAALKASPPRRLPADWKLPAEWMQWAMQERPEWSEATVLRVSLEFRDYWLGRGKAMADWLATWRGWVRRENRLTTGNRGNLTTAGQRTAEAGERWLARNGTDDREGES